MSQYDSKVLESFRSFVKSDFLNRDYEIYDTFFGNTVLTRVFRFEPPDIVSGLIGADGKKLVNESKRRVITIGKVIAIGDQCELALEKGDLVAISDNLISIQDNPALIQYLIETNGEKSGGIDAARPAPTINSFYTYRNTYGFVGDKLKEGELDADDFFTFLFPSNFIKAKIDVKKVEKWITGVQSRM